MVGSFDVDRDFSRRLFLRGSAFTTVGATMLNTTPEFIAKAQPGGVNSPVVGPDAVPIALQVNGVTRMMRIEPHMTLAEALRGPLGLTGTKIACNRGACSACTVWLDGDPVCACMILAIDVGERRVTTIEGLADGDTLHPVQQAFIDHDALQCGFCTPGMIMTCAALLEHTADPSASEVRAAISGHICRCGTYPHVIAATLDAVKARRE
jgi:carbon-monoxide dehydrogenase small subunit/xanthine dehydrogenase YagT iron-sulfur-binding subunit